MKTKIIATITALITLFSLTACQVTPEKSIVAPKDVERMIEAAKDPEIGIIPDELVLPENYSFSGTGADGKLTINANAMLNIPKGEIPIARVSAFGFTQEAVTGFFNYLFPDEKPIIDTPGGAIQTKSDIEAMIVQYRKYIEDGTTEEYTLMTEEETKKEIARLEKTIAKAPNTKPEQQVSDGTMLPAIYSYIGKKEDIFALNAYNEIASIAAYRPANDNEHSTGQFSFSSRRPDIPNFYEGEKTKITSATKTDGKVKLSYDAALKLCNDFFAAGGYTDIALGEAFLAKADDKYAYQFYFVRTVKNIPIALNICYSDGDEYSLPWEYELISIIIDDNDICSINWAAPTKLGEVFNENTKVISFEEATEIFEKMILITYEAKTADIFNREINIDVKIDEVALSTLRVREQNASGRTGLYVPAWVYYGHVERHTTTPDGVFTSYDGINVPVDKYIVLAINAIDGSIIDLAKGY